jgi:hypothetical protein
LERKCSDLDARLELGQQLGGKAGNLVEFVD